MKTILVLNRDAGTLRGLDADEVARGIRDIFAEHGHAMEMRVVAGDGVSGAIAKAAGDCDVEALIVGGGDGTVSSAASAAHENGKVLGILPLGTMNFFARSLSIPADTMEAAAALAGGEVVAVDIGRIDGLFFVHTVALGLHPAMVAEREKGDYNSRYGKMIGSLRAWIRVVRNQRRLDVAITANGDRLHRRTAGVVISNNRFGKGHMPYADRLDAGTLAVYVTTARSWPELVRVTAAAAIGLGEEDPAVEVVDSPRVEIAVGRRSHSVTVDGELLRLSGPLRLECLPGGLKVLKPREAAA